MPTYKSLIKIVWRHRVYLLIYLFGLCLMGVFMGTGVGDRSASTFSSSPTRVAVINRDGSELSQGLEKAVLAQGDPHGLADDQRAIQDAVARDTVSYILVIPQGWGEDLLSAASSGATAPNLETHVSYQSGAGSLMDVYTRSYASALYGYAATAGGNQADIVRAADGAQGREAQVSLVAQEAAPLPASFKTYCQFSTYPLFASIMICTAVLMAELNRRPISVRRMSAPTDSRVRGLRLFTACLTVGLAAWAWIALVGVALFARQALVESPILVAFALLGLLVYALLSVCVGFLVGQLGMSEGAANAVANVLGMVMSFLGGAWVDLSLLPSSLVTVAHFVPSFWCTNVISQAASLSNVSSASVMPLWGSLGIAALYALAILLVALVAGRSRGAAEL